MNISPGMLFAIGAPRWITISMSLSTPSRGNRSAGEPHQKSSNQVADLVLQPGRHRIVSAPVNLHHVNEQHEHEHGEDEQHGEVVAQKTGSWGVVHGWHWGDCSIRIGLAFKNHWE